MKNKRFIITLMVCITLIISFVLLTSYAYWKISKTQTGTNDIKGACLSIDLVQDTDSNDNPIKGFTLENAWPVSDEEGLNQNGYNFKVINTCEESITYQIVLDSLSLEDTNKEINSEHIKVAMDNGLIKNYGLLEDATTDDIEYETKESKVVFTGQIPGKRNDINGEVEHNIKIWISEDSDNDDIGKQFSSKVRVIAGQGLPHQEYAITPGECFEFDENTGTITGYDQENCTTEYLVVPQKINGVMVKSIDFYDEDLEDRSIEWDYLDLTNATGLETIGNHAFYKYVGAGQELTIPNSVTSIGTDTFQNYNGSKLILGNNIVTIATSAFLSYVGTGQELVIPDSVETIGNFAFDDYNGTKLILGNSIETIGRSTFFNYIGTNQELVIPNSVQTIGLFAFQKYNGPKLTLGKNVETIGNYAFFSYDGAGEELIIPDSVETIGNLAFYSYNGTKLTLGKGVETIGEGSFLYYVGTGEELIIPDSVQTIDYSAFQNYNGSKLTLGNRINIIGERAFNSYFGQIDINMTEAAFENVSVDANWKHPNATLNFLVQN